MKLVFMFALFKLMGSLIKEEIEKRKSRIYFQQLLAKATPVISARLENYSKCWSNRN